MTTLQHWWRTDTYELNTAIPLELAEWCGPQGVAIVRSWDDGTTDRGWGLKATEKSPGFMPLYMAGKFSPVRTLPAYERDACHFAFVMRSLNLVCIDIDGKNDGFTGVNRLGPLPETMAEVSKSGNGYHLFYSVPDDTWDETVGFAKYADKIGIEQGVDFRATGCVYHTKAQRWNERGIVALPPYLAQRLATVAQKISAGQDRIATILNTQEGHEILMLHTELIDDLAKPIPAGRRNNTLFAIGSKMKDAQLPGWEDLIEIRAKEVGLDSGESDKLVANIKAYSA